LHIVTYMILHYIILYSIRESGGLNLHCFVLCFSFPAVKQRVPDEREPPNRVPDDRVPDERVPDERLPTNRVPDERVPAKRVPDERVPANRVPDERVPANRVHHEMVLAIREPMKGYPLTGSTMHYITWYFILLYYNISQ